MQIDGGEQRRAALHMLTSSTEQLPSQEALLQGTKSLRDLKQSLMIAWQSRPAGPAMEEPHRHIYIAYGKYVRALQYDLD